MDKKLDELTISGDVHAPCQRGSVIIKLSNCLLCGHEKPDDITVLSEETLPIVHSLGPAEGVEGTVYELECGACGGRYNLGVISCLAAAACGETEISSVFYADEKTGWKWTWLGYY
jgi:transcription elongation factor Elf1